MELADLTRGMRKKNDFLEPENLIFTKPGLSEFHESSSLIFGEVAKDSLAQSAMR